MSIKATIQGGAGISASVTTKQVISQTLQVVWDANNDTNKNIFVDANEAEILTFTDNAIEISVGSSGIFDIYETLGDGLTIEEKYLMAVYLDREIANGNLSIEDWKAILVLSGNNARVDYIGGKILTLFNGATTDINGLNLDGVTQYGGTNYNPNDDGINYTLNDAVISTFVKTNDDTSVIKYLISGDGTINKTSAIRQQGDGTTRANINGSSSTNTFAENVLANTLYCARRETGTSVQLFKNGVQVDTRAVSTAGLTDVDFTIGQSGDGAGFYNGIISVAMMGGSIGRNEVEYNTNIRALLTGLGTLP